jgi:hypothetical protein
MNTLKVRVIKTLSSPTPSNLKVVANIYPLPDRVNRTILGHSSYRNELIPIGYFTSSQFPYQNFSIEPGRYMVEVVMPSGEVVHKEVTMLDDHQTVTIDLEASDSPYERLGWQRLAASVPGRTEFEQSVISKTSRGEAADFGTPEDEDLLIPRVTSVLTVESLPKSGLPNLLDRNQNLAARGLFFELHGLRSLEKSREPAFPSNVSVLSLKVPDPLSPFNEAESIGPLFIFNLPDLSRLAGKKEILSLEYKTDTLPRYYLYVSGPGIPHQYSVIPVPWRLPDWSDEADVEGLVQTNLPLDKSSPGLDQGYRLSIVVKDDLISSMIAYMGSGKLDAASAIAQHARGLLFEKMGNPIAAAAGAYVMVALWDPGGRNYWHYWVANLMNWFPWLPDGAILYAWVLLKSDRSRETLSESRAALLEGFRRGLPYYSMGVRMLLDGLTLFHDNAMRAGSKDIEVEKTLKVVRRLAMRTSRKQVFTSILL